MPQKFAFLFEIGYNTNMLNLVVAPKSADKCAERFAKKVVRYLKFKQVEYSVYFSGSMQQLEENVKELFSFGETNFVVVGGDSVLGLLLNLSPDISRLKIGLIPTKHCDFANYLHINSNPMQAIKDILANKLEKVDLLQVNGKKVLNNVLVGASVLVAKKYMQYAIKNPLTEKIAIVKYGNTFDGIDLSLELGSSKAKKEKIFELSIANAGLSKGKPVSPLSNMQDGLFNLNYANISNKKDKKTYSNLYKNGKHIYSNFSKQFWLSEINIKSPSGEFDVLIDGQLESVNSIQVRILESVLNVYKSKS